MRTPKSNKDEGVKVDAFMFVENTLSIVSILDVTNEQKIREILGLLEDLETQARATYNNWFVKPARLGVVK